MGEEKFGGRRVVGVGGLWGRLTCAANIALYSAFAMASLVCAQLASLMRMVTASPTPAAITWVGLGLGLG